VTIPYIEGESMVLMLGEAGICCATGSACSTHDLEPSHVLSAIGQDADLIHGSLRFTFGRTTTKEELDHTAQTLGGVVSTLLEMTACTTAVYQRAYCTL
jgi:cysteine desulfurase